MNNGQAILLIAVLALSVWITRFLPFLVFQKSEDLPKTVRYLGRVLPAAMMGLLVVYCFRDLEFRNLQALLPALIASLAVIGLHLWKRNTILSIFAGTALYILLLRIF